MVTYIYAPTMANLTLRDIVTGETVVSFPTCNSGPVYFGKSPRLESLAMDLEVESGLHRGEGLREITSFQVGGGVLPVKTAVAVQGEEGLGITFAAFGDVVRDFEYVGKLHGVIQATNGVATLYDFCGATLYQGDPNVDDVLLNPSGTLVSRLNDEGEREYHMLHSNSRSMVGRKVGGGVVFYEIKSPIDDEEFPPSIELRDGDRVFLGYSMPNQEVLGGQISYLDFLEALHERELFYGLIVDLSSTPIPGSVASPDTVLGEDRAANGPSLEVIE